MADIHLNIKTQIADLQKDMKKVQTGQKELAKQSTKTQKTMQKNISGTSKAVNKLGQQLAAVLTIGAAVQFTKAIINVRKEFETYNAVLTTSLGSAKAANREFEKIQQFAAETPFSVKELTDSFVRLVNQGFKPTREEMRKLGDLAASTGKDFIQLTEAIIDAQTGEFERLKEFGIRAKKEGDNVTFTFKEQETQVDFTASAIQGYILSLGDLEGVMGSMSAISETLGGRISNLHDAWDLFLNSLGEKSSGAFKKALGGLTGLLNMLAEYNELQEGITKNSKEFIALFTEDLAKLSIEDRIASANVEIAHFNEEYQQMLENSTNRDEFSRKERKSFEALAVTYRAITIGLGDYVAEQEELLANQEEVIEKFVRDPAYYKNIIQAAKLAKELREQFKIEAEQEVDPLKVVEEDNKLRLDVLDAQIDQEIELYKDRSDAEIAEIDRVKAARLEQKEFELSLWDARGQAAMAGLDLIGSVNRENAELQKAVAITQAIINGALAVTKIQSQAGVLAPPLIVASILTTLAQIATIRQQKFERGGYDVLKGRRHAQGGVDIGIGEAEAGEGLAVFSRQATQKYGKFLPAFVKAINENDADLGYSDGAYMISFDDSKSVKELKGINEKLNRPEIRYEKGYRIETRKGQVTKVKI
jgi:hypothetical protein